MSDPRDIALDPGDLPTERWWGRERQDGTIEYRVFLGPSANELRRRWRKANLEPRLLAALRRRLAALGG